MTTSNITNAGLYSIWPQRFENLFHYSTYAVFSISVFFQRAQRLRLHLSILLAAVDSFQLTFWNKPDAPGRLTWLIQIGTYALNWHIFSAFSKAAKNTMI